MTSNPNTAPESTAAENTAENTAESTAAGAQDPRPARSISEQVSQLAEQVSELAERAVTLPLGAGLTIRDDVSSSLRRMQRKYATSAGIEKQLNRYERRGARARKGFERQVRGQGRKLERELRGCGRDLQKHSAALGARVEELISAAQALIS